MPECKIIDHFAIEKMRNTDKCIVLKSIPRDANRLGTRSSKCVRHIGRVAILANVLTKHET